MAIVNPGNALPFYDNILDQVRYRTGDQNFHIVADWEYFIPFQVPLPDIPTTFRVHIVGRDIGQVNYDVTGNTAYYCDGDRMVIVFDGQIRPELECGYYYVQIQTGPTLAAVNYFSEMVYVEQRNDHEKLKSSSITYNGTDDEFTFNFADQVTTDKLSTVNEVYSAGSWVAAGTGTSVVVSGASSVFPLPDGTEERFIRRTVDLKSGSLLQTIFRVHWNPADKVGTVTIAPFSTNNKHHRKDRFFLTATNAGDFNNGDIFILYTLDGILSYTQRIDLPGYLDFPRGETTLGTITDGNGNNKVKSIIAKERRAVRFGKIPDDLLFFFQLLPKHDTVTLTDVNGGRTYTLAEMEVRVEPEPGGDFSTVELSWRYLSTSLAGCDETLTFDVCTFE
jgi:hypothetical protein